MFGAADDVPKKLGRFDWSGVKLAYRLVVVAGWPGMGGLFVAATVPKKVVLPPSGAVTDGFWTVSGELRAVPLASKTWICGPAELYGSLASGFWPRNGGGDHHGTAPTPIVDAAELWP